jgi:predicted MFS family arabinose efflux permease
MRNLPLPVNHYNERWVDGKMNQESYNVAANRKSTIVAALIASAVGVLMYNVLPLFLGSAQDLHDLTNIQTGLMGTAFFLGFNVAGATAFYWIRRISWRLGAIISAPITCFALFVSNLDLTFAVVLAAVCISGGTSGILYSIGTTIIGDTSAPNRWYGVKVAIESAAGTLLLFLLPVTLTVRYGPAGVVYGMIGVIILLLPIIFFLPRTWQKKGGEIIGNRIGPATSLDRIAIFSAVISLLMVFAGISAIWAFAERMGKLSGYDDEWVGRLLAITLMSGIFSSLGIAYFGERVHRVKTYTASLGVVFIGLLLLSIPGAFVIYAIGNCLYMMGWSVATPLASAEIAQLDTDGRYTSMIVPAIGIGSMIGPFAAGAILEEHSPIALFVFVASSILVAAVLMIFASVRARKTYPIGAKL